MTQLSAAPPRPLDRTHIAMSIWTVTAAWLAVLTLVVAGVIIEDLIDRFGLRDRPPATTADYVAVCVTTAIVIVLLVGPVGLYWSRRARHTAET